jgi:hypothetical protein
MVWFALRNLSPNVSTTERLARQWTKLVRLCQAPGTSGCKTVGGIGEKDGEVPTRRMLMPSHGRGGTTPIRYPAQGRGAPATDAPSVIQIAPFGCREPRALSV